MTPQDQFDAAMEAALHLLKREFPSAIVTKTHLHCIDIRIGGLTAATFTNETFRHRTWRASGPHIIGGRRSYRGSYIERKDLPALIETVRPFVRTDLPSEAARKATQMASGWLSSYSYLREPNATELFAYLSDGSCAEEIQAWRTQYEQWAINAAAISGMQEMWHHFDGQIEKRERSPA